MFRYRSERKIATPLCLSLNSEFPRSPFVSWRWLTLHVKMSSLEEQKQFFKEELSSLNDRMNIVLAQMDELDKGEFV